MKTIDMCDQLQNFFWRVMLTVPESCPKIALRSETGMLGMKWRVWREKIMLFVRIKMHEECVLARQIYEEGKARGWPGLGEEVTKICEVIGIPDVNHVNIPKQTIISAIERNHYEDLKSELEHSKKLKDIKDEDFTSVQEYFRGSLLKTPEWHSKFAAKCLRKFPEMLKINLETKRKSLSANIAPQMKK